MKYLLILNIFLYISIKKIGVEAELITCSSGTYKITGEGDACCTLHFWGSGTLYGGNVVPYNSKTQSCCRADRQYFDKIEPLMTTESGKLVNGSACCLDMGYDNKTQRCCIQHSAKAGQGRSARVGYGDSCCGVKIYNRTTHGCCSGFSSVARAYLYTPYDLANSCCEFGVVYDGKKCHPTSDNYKKNSALSLKIKINLFYFILFYIACLIIN
jgi:hypothetical protein